MIGKMRLKTIGFLGVLLSDKPGEDIDNASVGAFDYLDLFAQESHFHTVLGSWDCMDLKPCDGDS